MRITICDKEYEITCNAYTRYKYKEIFNRKMASDLNILNEFSTNQEKTKNELKEKGLTDKEIEEQINYSTMESLDDLIDVIERITYIVIYTANEKIGSFEEWLKNIEYIDLSANWIEEVTKLVVNSFCR